MIRVDNLSTNLLHLLLLIDIYKYQNQSYLGLNMDCTHSDYSMTAARRKSSLFKAVKA